MIYTVIADTEVFRTLSEKLNKRDCRDTRQPLTLIPEDIFDYIKSGKSEEIKIERLAAYSTLFFALSELYGKKNCSLCRTELGKPYLTECGELSKIHISISHTEGAVAVALSDECEVGVDIQGEIDENRAERLEKRFFKSINIKEENIPLKLLCLNLSDNAATFEEAVDIEKVISDFTEKWVFCEALLKCDGGGFGSLEKINEIQKQAQVSINRIKINKKQFAVAIAIKSTIM